MNVKKIAGTAVLTGALGAATLGVAGAAQADPKHQDPNPVPSDTDFTQPPGQVGRDLGVAPGQLKQQPQITVGLPDGSTVDIDNPFEDVPPGHWGDVAGDFDDAVDAATP
jgi:hypothetical protein